MKTADELLLVIPFQKMEVLKNYNFECLKKKRQIPTSYTESRMVLLGNRLSILVNKTDFTKWILDLQSLLNFKIDIDKFTDNSIDVINSLKKLEIKTIKDKEKWIKKPFPFIDELGNLAYIKIDHTRFSTIPVRQNIKGA